MPVDSTYAAGRVGCVRNSGGRAQAVLRGAFKIFTALAASMICAILARTR